MFDRRLLVNFEWPLLVITLVICFVGVVNLYSATFSGNQEASFPLYLKQTIFILLALLIMIPVILIDYRILDQYAYVFYGFSVALLALVLVLGDMKYGSRRWLSLGVFSFQPSELAKISLVLALAHYFHRNNHTFGYSLRNLVVPFAMIALVASLIIVEPDLGTVIIFLLISGSLILFLKVKGKSLLILFFLILIPLPFTWSVLKNYQKDRILTFLNPERDPLGSGYHLIQSKIAIGSGGFLGKGYLKGSQNRLHFLPEQHTDFAFSVLAEEWGFAGCLFLFSLFLALILYGLSIAMKAKDRLGTILALGIVAMLFWPAVINIGMTTGMLPVVGVSLPFISYGGSSIVSSMIGIGLLLNIGMRRFIF